MHCREQLDRSPTADLASSSTRTRDLLQSRHHDEQQEEISYLAFQLEIRIKYQPY
jgi:hypothetical protein